MLHRRQFLQLSAAAAAPAQPQPPPNIVLILADDLGSADLGCYGSTEVRTPNIDALARESIRFTRAYCNAPECTPSRCALLTGRYQQRVGGLECAIGLGGVGRYDEAEWLAKRGELGLPVEEITIARMLKDRGYDTAHIGKWHLGYEDKFSPNHHGFDESFGILGGGADYFRYTEDNGAQVLRHNGKPATADGYLTDVFGKRAIEWLKQRRADKPYFLYLPFNAPHAPFQGPRDRDVTPVPWTGGPRGKTIELIESLDVQVGAVLAQIAKMSTARNTIVLFMSDNGAPAGGSNAPLRGQKGTVWEGGIRMPLLIRWPDHIRAGESNQVTLMMDLTVTLLAAAGANPPKGRVMDGIDIMPVLTAAQPVIRRTVFWGYKRLQNRRQAVLDGEMKYVIDNGAEALFDLATDPREQHNLITDRPAIAGDLRRKVAAWQTDVAAPRLRGWKSA